MPKIFIQNILSYDKIILFGTKDNRISEISLLEIHYIP